MTIEKTLTTINLLHNDLKIVKELVYDKCDFQLTNLKLKLNAESNEYAACSFELNRKNIEHRVSKITPTKTGQFVAIWKRNKDGITEPFGMDDKIDFMIITARSGENFGQFIFPKLVLADKGIITQNTKEGKRGIRVYPPWDITNNKQAIKTQMWQLHYFLVIKKNATDLELAKELLK